jgi:FkbM family methyltransferase
MSIKQILLNILTRYGRRHPNLTSAMLKYYFRHFPFYAGKLKVWEKFVGPHLASRQMDIIAKLRNGSRLYGSFPDVIHVYSYFFGVWEPAVTAYYQRVVRPGDIVLDIGANVGVHALLAAQLVGDTGRVHAVEASPLMYCRLKRNLEANYAHNVIAYNFAVLDRTEPVTVFLNKDENLGGTTVILSEALKRGSAPEGVVEGRPLSAIVPVPEICAARLIKIDVEGAEWLVIKGMQDLFPLLHPNVEILIEVSPCALAEFGISVAELLRTFSHYGFLPFQVPNRYTPDFYLRRSERELLPLEHHEFDLADIVFRRCPRDHIQ